jgi:hypothetical protein
MEAEWHEHVVAAQTLETSSEVTLRIRVTMSQMESSIGLYDDINHYVIFHT